MPGASNIGGTAALPDVSMSPSPDTRRPHTQSITRTAPHRTAPHGRNIERKAHGTEATVATPAARVLRSQQRIQKCFRDIAIRNKPDTAATRHARRGSLQGFIYRMRGAAAVH